MAFSDDSALRDMASLMKVKFDKYWEGTEKINKILIVAGVLDPRRKMVFTMLSFELIYGKGNPKCIEMKELVMDVLEKLFKIYSVRYAAYDNSNLQSSATRDGENLTQVHQDSESMEVDNIDDPFLKFMVAKKTSLEVVNELEKYLKDELHVTTENSLGLPFDLLDWWKTNSSKYPIMSLMAREILAVPVSSVASESAFSTGGRILDQYRSCLNPEMVEALVLTQDWLRASLRSEAMKSLDNLEEKNKFLDSLEEEFNPPSQTENDRTSSFSLKRIGLGLTLSSISMAVAAIVEAKRKHEAVQNDVRISVFLANVSVSHAKFLGYIDLGRDARVFL
ncbi:unnamed protein product [Arabidopsis arenosa]|uniref:Uncharacterized protein n=1 Tax=Arabidopsis arenosa TaxID=38785 RepID=A0A8S2A2H1_ARAAE|nr:unnamed protein product [Arabidopsis arenosa]